MGPIIKCNNPLNLKLHVLSATLYTRPPPPAAGFLKKIDTLLYIYSISACLHSKYLDMKNTGSSNIM